MRCECCDAVLTPAEQSLRFKTSKTLAYTCRHCLSSMDTPILERDDDSYDEEDIISLDELLAMEEMVETDEDESFS